ncbi:FAD-binding Berberine family protein [Hibiscus syriacus]|uniref:FAD-binding Berberine family protein n=1 Tax=Hibiscus syriacus TaxID=106335 RepID=A0A6A3CZQ1_HIBSY|nr:berberine bridge enzyme-like 18 [Hibiscus syriacus]KAE8733937.1 FAD-binding Berberine family protein [Hibiscus syriacus]
MDQKEWFPFLLAFLISLPWKITTSALPSEKFLHCLSLRSQNSSSIAELVFTQQNSTYSFVLKSTAKNSRFTTPSTPTPLAIITPMQVSHVQATVSCCRKLGLQLRFRSGGHDFEGLSYTTAYKVPFVVIDLVNLRSVQVNVEKATAWVESGATIGELYYEIARRSRTLAFPAGVGHTVGLGGHLSGGGEGLLLRKFGLAADNVIDARLVDVDGRNLDRKSMGEELFWAIRGGGGGSFGIVLAWELKLVSVPANLTSCSVTKTLEQNATKLVHQWLSIGHKLPKEVHMNVRISRIRTSEDEKKMTIQASFGSVFLGKIDEFVPLMENKFPELDLTKEDCLESSWAESILYSNGFPVGIPLETLLDRNRIPATFFKAKSDSVKQSIPATAFEGLWPKFFEEEAKTASMTLTAYGGKMDEIPETETPNPHRAGNLYNIIYVVTWEQKENKNPKKFMSWMRRVHSFMTPFVSKSPREAYVNYRDLEIGANEIDNDEDSYEQAKIWGVKYFKNNFDRLVHVKTIVDPGNFFRHEQSIPPLSRLLKKRVNRSSLDKN